MGLSSLWPLSSIEMYFSLVPSMDAALTWLTFAARLAATSSEASSGLLISCVSVNLFFTSFAKQAHRSRKGGFTGCANVFSPIPVTA